MGLKVRHCPRCGSDNINKSSGSAEYSSWATYSCDECGWKYKSGSGMGNASRNSGTHPRDVGSDSKQRTLTSVGRYCRTCEVCAINGHCGCVEDGQTGYCKECAKYAEIDMDEMLEVTTYFGRHKDSPFECDICGDREAKLKTLD